MGKTVRTSKQFADNFKLVAAHYACTPSEIEAMKQAAREDMANAEISFAALSAEILQGVAA
jgi:hypothetical protein